MPDTLKPFECHDGSLSDQPDGSKETVNGRSKEDSRKQFREPVRSGNRLPSQGQSTDRRRPIGPKFFLIAASLLFIKVLAEIVYEYRWYFPANFDSSFLMGRKETFVGAYRVAFYTHILIGPVTVLLGAFLMFSGTTGRSRKQHRWVGRIQAGLVTCLLVPTSMVMAVQAYTGPIAAIGFFVHAMATGTCAVLAVWHATRRQIQLHRRWATRCFILLCAPLLLRVISGATIALKVDSDWTYRVTVWLCWVIPLFLYQCCSSARSSDAIRKLPIQNAGGFSGQ